MPEAFLSSLQAEGTVWIVLAALAAGLVRGFSGFGTTMVFMPVAALFLQPFAALTLLVVMDLIGPLPNVPRAMRDADLPDIGRLVLGAMLGLPFGVALLASLPAEMFRWAVCLITLLLLGALVSGWRYRGRLSGGLTAATGGLGGFLGGATGLAGPPAILLYMASTLPVATIRANLLIYLVAVDVLLMGVFGATGRISEAALWLAIAVVPAYLLGNICGAAVFDPGRERGYRRVAYAIIAASAVTGLPIWS